MKKLLFEYHSVPVLFNRGLPTTSIALYNYGVLVKRYYNESDTEPEFEYPLAVIPEMAAQVEDVLTRRKDSLAQIPASLYNGSFDGCMEYFVFGDFRISTLNVERRDPEEVKRRNPRYFEKFQANITHENIVIDIYNEIVAILKHFVPDLDISEI